MTRRRKVLCRTQMKNRSSCAAVDLRTFKRLSDSFQKEIRFNRFIKFTHIKSFVTKKNLSQQPQLSIFQNFWRRQWFWDENYSIFDERRCENSHLSHSLSSTQMQFFWNSISEDFYNASTKHFQIFTGLKIHFWWFRVSH